MKLFRAFLVLSFVFASTANSQNFKNGVVSSANKLASQTGIEILKRGGNAIDAAVGVGFVLAVVYPTAGNIGGGGFMVISFPDGNSTTIDYREKAPYLSTRDMYLDENGEVIEDLSSFGHLAAGVPGSVAGMLYALEKYGTMKREEVLSYAIELAEKGFPMEKELVNGLKNHKEEFSQFDGSKQFFAGNWKKGDIFIQQDLANTLKLISQFGRDGFYKGRTADLIVEEMKRGNGIISYKDLEEYNVIERPALYGNYRGFDIISMPPPSSGGICVIYLLNILEQFDLAGSGFKSTGILNVMIEAMRRVYADRSEFMGDADFVPVPYKTLTSKEYAKKRFSNFIPGKAGNSKEIGPGKDLIKEGDNTTHYSIADKNGMLVSVTTTINDTYGNKVVVKDAGFLLNNEMDDFSTKPGSPNIFGLLGGYANSITPGKRPLSSMTPTIILKDGKPFMITGSPGGGKIITSVLQMIINVIDYNFSLQAAIDEPRIHHQWFPDVVFYENGSIEKTTLKVLKDIGYSFAPIGSFGRIDAILFNPDGSMSGYSDRRGYGEAIGY